MAVASKQVRKDRRLRRENSELRRMVELQELRSVNRQLQEAYAKAVQTGAYAKLVLFTLLAQGGDTTITEGTYQQVVQEYPTLRFELKRVEGANEYRVSLVSEAPLPESTDGQPVE